MPVKYNFLFLQTKTINTCKQANKNYSVFIKNLKKTT
jgi:hypothetical protein